MTEIFLIRHTQAEGNLYRMMQGHWDGDVTELGWKQIEALAERFSHIHVDAVYSSDLYRARMTATAVTRHGDLPLNCDKRLREIDLGSWEAGFFGNLSRLWPEKMNDFLMHPGRWHVEGAETCAQVQQRAYGALCEIAAKHDGQTVALVSHGMTLRCLFTGLHGLDLSCDELPPIHGNTAVSRLVYDKGSFRIDFENDSSHLESMGLPPWHKSQSLRHESVDPMNVQEWYCGCYEKSWLAAHGSLRGFSALNYLSNAAAHHQSDEEAVLRFFCEEECVGLLDMDTERGAAEGIGWISLIYLDEAWRNQGYGVQLLARALKKYSALDRRCIRLTVAESNTPAVAFYEKNGFSQVGTEKNALGRLLLMERSLEGRKYA